MIREGVGDSFASLIAMTDSSGVIVPPVLYLPVIAHPEAGTAAAMSRAGATRRGCL